MKEGQSRKFPVYNLTAGNEKDVTDDFMVKRVDIFLFGGRSDIYRLEKL